ncbi:6-pyruvoyl tetrahydrobiopterin synthase [Chionoecetes opilio]|uniref:6-pyruvoyltetrahydropterin synthase n=1 Tax=Chionoecetes opilio TaxID=41210 RepID=A0A8J5BZ61_CHIOP|nr:6-pyruvoyl tetrahydrobiopterin synthase [Chionoecetes opilio]
MNNTCTLYGEGLAAASSSNTFIAFPAPHTLQDVATNKKAYASSNWEYDGNANPSYAVDTIETDETMFHSMPEPSPWWLLDLHSTQRIHDVQILSRRECCSERFHNVEIRVGDRRRHDGDFSSYTLFSKYAGPYTPDQGRLSCARGDGVSVDVTVRGPVDEVTGMVINVSDLKVIIQEVVMNTFDHKNVDLDVPVFRDTNLVSTAENIAVVMYDGIQELLPGGLKLHRIRLHETGKNVVDYYGNSE